MLIGDFARRCRLPISTLRYYDRIGLLAPAVIDPTTGYRHYLADQLPAAVLIARLRALGTAPHDIAVVLTGGARATAVLAAERSRISSQVTQAQRALAEINDLIAHDVQLIDFARHQVVAAPFVAPHADLKSVVVRAIARLRHDLRRAGCERTGPWGATFPLEITEQVSGFVFARTNGDSGLDTVWLPATRAAQTVHHDGPDTLAHAYHATLSTIDQHGRSPTGPVIEEYLSSSIRLTVPVADE